MSEQLTPNKGDRVRLVHTNGDEAVVHVKDLFEQKKLGWKGIETEGATFFFNEGWTVAEILEKPLPPEGTFIQGTYEGKRFFGIVRAVEKWEKNGTPKVELLTQEVSMWVSFEDLDSWEVIA